MTLQQRRLIELIRQAGGCISKTALASMAYPTRSKNSAKTAIDQAMKILCRDGKTEVRYVKVGGLEYATYQLKPGV